MKIYDLMRPEKMYKDIIRQREIDGITFYNKYNNDFVNVNCPACENKGKLLFEKYGFKHRVCENCKTIFCSPRPSEKLLNIYYNQFESPKMWTRLLLETDAERKILQHESRVNKIISIMSQKRGRNGGIVIDVGAGSGAFSSCLKKSEFFTKVIALDLSEDCINVCRKSGLDTICGTIWDLKDNSADLICTNDLIEHLFDPLNFLKKCYKVLSDGGNISIATPNGEGFDFKIFEDNTENITPPEHLNYFNCFSINLLLAKAGFQTIFLETPGKLDVEIVLNKRNKGYLINENNKYIDFLLEQSEETLENFQKFLSENKLSSHMFIIGKK
jgi:2-polyprenyl-3-methyl-5-hydroxy-6-metoxy-1,4-benzoquinol methylase/ribosomal protein S27E